MSDLLAVLLLGAAGFAVLWAVGMAMRKREQRWASDDWRRGGPSMKVGNALLEVQSLIEPGAGAALEERQRGRKESEAEGDPPNAGDKQSPKR